MSKTLDLNATTARIRQNLIWQTVVAAEKAAIVVSSRKNSKRTVTADTDPLNQIDNLGGVDYLERLADAGLSIDEDNIKEALDPYYQLGGRAPQSFARQADLIIKQFKDDPVLKTIDFDTLKAEVYDLSTRRTALSKTRFQLRNKQYLSTIGFTDSMLLFQETVAQMTDYNKSLDDLRAKYGVKFNETNSLQADLAYQQAEAVLKQSQTALASIYAYLKSGKLYHLDMDAHRAVESFFQQRYSPEVVRDMQMSRDNIIAELQRRNVQTANMTLDTLPLNISKAERELNDAIALSNSSTFSTAYSIVEQVDALHAKYDQLIDHAVSIAQPADSNGNLLAGSDLRDWIDATLESMESRTQESRDRFNRLSQEVQHLLLEAAHISEQIEDLEDSDQDTESVESEDDEIKRNSSRIDQYSNDIKSFLVSRFNIPEADVDDYLSNSKSEKVDLLAFIKSRKLTVIDDTVNVFDGSNWIRINDTDDLKDELQRLDSLLQYSGSASAFLKSDEARNELIEAQIETINQAKASLALLEFKSLFSRLSLTDEEAKLFKFITAAVAAKRDSSEALRQAQDMQAPEANMVLDGLPSVENIPQDVLIKAFENNSFDLMKPYEAELNNLTYKPLRHSNKDFDLYTATPIEHLQNQLIAVEKQRGDLFRNQINVMKARIHDINNNLKGVDGLSINNRRYKLAQLNTLRMHVERQLELLQSVMLTPEELPIPDPNQTDPNVIFVQGLKKLVEIRPVVVSGQKTFEVTLRDYIKDTGPAEHKLGQTDDDDDDGIPLFISQDKFVDMSLPAPTKLSTQVEVVPVYRSVANLKTLSAFLEEAAVDDTEFVPNNRNNNFMRSTAMQSVRSAIVSGNLNSITLTDIKTLYGTKDEVTENDVAWFDPKTDLPNALALLDAEVKKHQDANVNAGPNLRSAIITPALGLIEEKFQYNVTVGRVTNRQDYDDYISRCVLFVRKCLETVPAFKMDVALAPDEVSSTSQAIIVNVAYLDALYQIRQVAQEVFPASEKFQQIIGVLPVSAMATFDKDLVEAFRHRIDANLGDLRRAAQSSDADQFNELLDSVLTSVSRTSMFDKFVEHADAETTGVSKRDDLIDALNGIEDTEDAEQPVEPEVVETPAAPSQPVEPEPVAPPVVAPVEAPTAINPPQTEAVDAKGSPLLVGDKISVSGGLQQGRVTKITDSSVELELDLPGNKTSKLSVPFAEIQQYNVKKLQSVLKPVEPEPVEKLDVDPCFLNVEVAPIFDKYNVDYRKYVHVDFSLPANNSLRESLVLEVTTLMSAHPEDKILRKLMLGVPLKRSIGNLSPALLNKLVELGYNKYMVNNWSEEIARKVLLKKSDPFLKAARPDEIERLKQLGWTDEDIANFSTLDAYQRIGQRMVKPRNIKNEDVAAKVVALESKLAQTPSIINSNTAPQATVVSVKDALEQQLTQTAVEIDQTKALDTQEVDQLIVAIRDLKKRVDESDTIVAAASGNTNARVEKSPGLTDQENTRLVVLKSVINNLRRSADSLSAIVKQTKDQNHTIYLNETRVNIEVYQQQINNLVAKSKRYAQQEDVKKFLEQPKPQGLNVSPVSYGLKTVHDFGDNTTKDFDDGSYPKGMDSLTIVPMHKAPEVVEQTTPSGNPPVGPKVILEPKKHVKQVVKPAQTKNHRPPSGHSKGHRKSNLRVKNLMKLSDFFKANS